MSNLRLLAMMHIWSMISSLKWAALPVFAVLAVTATVLPVDAHAQVESPTTVVEAWLDARAAHDVERAVALLDDNAFLIFADFPDEEITVYEGRAEIRQVL